MDQAPSSLPSSQLFILLIVVGVGLYMYLYGVPTFTGYSPVELLVGGSLLAGVVFLLYLGVTDPLSLYTFLILAGVLVFVLYYLGFISWNSAKSQLEVSMYEPKPSTQSPISLPRPVNNAEVFYVAENQFSYDQAQAVCQAYGSELASYSQVEQAYNSGGEWCGYGWSQGGLALFPTQLATWQTLQGEVDQSKRTACGRPGINGGYFDPLTKFGVNCYGKKPTRSVSQTGNAIDKALNSMVKQYKEQIKKFTVAPFDKKQWSEKIVDSDSGIPNMGGEPVSEGGKKKKEYTSAGDGGYPPLVDADAPLGNTTGLGLRGFQNIY